MLRKTMTATLIGIEAQTILVETDVQPGLPYVNVVGLAGTTIKESRERVRAAIVNSGFEYPKQRITISLSPAGVPKEGSHFDLPIAVGIMGAIYKNLNARDFGFIGELSLGGMVKGVRGALPMAMSLRESGIRKIILPEIDAQEVSLLKDVELYPVKTLKECIEFLEDKREINTYKRKEFVLENNEKLLDFADVKCNEFVKRALTVAAAGNHGILMMGSPGCGKTMMAKRLPLIMPEMEYEELLEVTKIHSVAGNMGNDYILSGRRPFREPHYTITKAAFIGGGNVPHPGEVSLAHNGVLFLDEFGQFSPSTIELLRQPLEEGKIKINRAKMEVDFPCRLMLVAASNPCKCGYFGDENHICTCTKHQLDQYYSKFSGPMLDRIDMHVMVSPVNEYELNESPAGMDSAEMKRLVTSAAAVQKARYEGTGIYFNSRLSDGEIKKFCGLDKESEAFIRGAFVNLGLSMRSYNKILKVSRTIADIAGAEKIAVSHIAEALQYRSMERFYRM